MKSPACCLPGHEQHLAHPDPLEELERVVDHRPAADREQVLVRDARQLLEPRRRPACADQSLHRPGRCYSQRAGAERAWCVSSGEGGTRTSRAGARGSHQFQRPRIAIMLGTRMQRTIVASTKIATASPSPNSCSPTMLPARKPGERGAHDDRRRGDDPARPLEPVRDRRLVVVALVPRLAHAGDQEHLVVHREAEEHREEEDRDPALDLVELVEAEQALPDAEAEEDDEHPVARRRPRAG